MNAEHKKMFMQRWRSMKEAKWSHPYALWVAVDMPRTPPECLALSDKAWRVDGENLKQIVNQHIKGNHKDCCCRLRPITLSKAISDNIVLMD